MARSTNKGPMLAVTSSAAAALDRCSKAALVDMVCELVALLEGHADETPSLEELARHVWPVLQVRGDRVPQGLTPTGVR